MQPEWRVTYFDDSAFYKLLGRFRRPMQERIALFIDRELRLRGTDSVAAGNSRALGQGLYELKVSFRPEVELRIFYTARPGRVIVIISAYDKKSNDSKSWQNTQIQSAKSKVKSLEEK
jgi:phage-related protein